MEISDCHILLVDDEKDLLYMVRDLLKEEGYRTVDSAASCKEAEEMVAKNQYELVILDVMLPDGNGFSFFQEQIREKDYSGIPVIFLSARDENEAKLKGLGLGADDYITKPFLPQELMLRVKAVLMRTYRLEETQQDLQLQNVMIRFDDSTIIRDGKVQTMTAKEYMLLRKLAENKGKIVSIDSLCDTLWPDGSYGLESSLMVHIRHIREKIEADPSRPEHLITMRGLGYKLC